MTRKDAIDILVGVIATNSEEENEALDMAIEALEQEPIIRCEDCKHHGTSNCPMWGDDTTEDYMWCCDGERRENNEK